VTDPSDPRPIGEPLIGPDGPAQGLAIAPDGGQVAAVGLGDGVFRWLLQDSVTSLPLLSADEITWSVAYHPTRPVLAAGFDDGGVVLWERTDDPVVLAEFDLGDSSVLAVDFAPDGGVLAAGSRAGEVAVWDVSGPAEPVSVELAEAGFDSWVNTAAFSHDGK